MSLRRKNRWAAALSLLCGSLLSAAFAPAQEPKAEPRWDPARTTPSANLAEVKALQERVTAVSEKCTACTVAILIGFGAGSGVIVSDDGLVLTTASVLTGESQFERANQLFQPVPRNPTPAQLQRRLSGGTNLGDKKYDPGKSCTLVLPDGTRVKGKTLGIDVKADTGMIQITDKGPNDGKWPFLPMGKAADLKAGQWVVALGHPGGPKSGRPPAVRLGYVKEVGKDLVRTNCTLREGDFGGPLVDLEGRVVGVHSRIGVTLDQNLHIPAEEFQSRWKGLAAGEVFGRKGPPPRFGVVFPDNENDEARVVEFDDDGPAAKAGVNMGDAITKVGDQSIKSVKQFREVVQKHKPGDVVKLTVQRGTETKVLMVTLGGRP